VRALALLSLAVALSAPAQAQASRTFDQGRAGLSLEIQDGYLLKTACEVPTSLEVKEGTPVACSDLPRESSAELRTASYHFADQSRQRFLSVAVRHDLGEEERADWIAGTLALSGLGGTFTPAEASAWTDGSASAATWAEAGGAGVALYGCEGWRCYRVFVVGLAVDLAADPGHYRAVLDGVRVHPLSASVAPLPLER
jgi:hypothetical protein